MSRIFISYRRTDAGGHAGLVFYRLRNQFGAQQVFFDQDAIEPGDHFPDRIEVAIRSAGVVLVVIGPDWLESLNARAEDGTIDFVQREVSIALERKGAADDRVEVIPILVGGTAMPGRHGLHDTLRDSIGPLFEYQALPIQGGQQDQDHQFEQLIAKIEAVFVIVSRESTERFDEQPVLSIQASTPATPTLGPERRTRLPRIDSNNIERAFRSVSRLLLDWPQEIDGHWIERPELSRLHELTMSSSPSVTVLLGGPGEGKSAILARLGSLLAQDGTVLLAIKADRVPREVASLRQLDDWIDCGVELASTLRRVASERRVVVLIDQLDALGELMDQHSGRLSSLLRLVESIRDTQNLHVIVSCREFEFRYDARLNTLRAEEVALAPLPWDRVLPVLNARKIDTDRWSDEVRAVLCTPHNLAIYVELLVPDVSAPDFTSYQALLDRVIRERVERVYGHRTVRAAERVAAEMAVEEELSLGRARFPDLRTELANLESAGLLLSSENGLRVSFRHQTLFDVLRARSFLQAGTSLADFVLKEKNQSLFVRPTVWSTLKYLRESDAPTYRSEFRRLWVNPSLRLHLRYMLIAFLGQVSDPTDEEVGRLFSKLDAPDTCPRVLWAMAGNAAGWFSRLKDRLPQLMTAPSPQAWATVSLLAGAVSRHRDTVLGLVRRQWMTDVAYLRHAVYVLCDLHSWDAAAMSVATACVDRVVDQTPNDTFMFRGLLKASARSGPSVALKLLTHYLNARTRRITSDLSDAGTEHGSSWSRSEEYRRLLRDTIWYEIKMMFDKYPMELIEQVWPWFIDVVERLGKERASSRNAYRGHTGLIFSGAADESDFFQNAMEEAIRGLAEDYPDDFLGFVKENEGSDLNVVHRLLALGLERIAAKRPQAVLRYLLADSRRLAIAEVWYDYDAIRSLALIAALVPALGTDDARRLEAAILAWRYYSDDPTDSDAKYRLDLKKWSREHRLPLLRAFSFERLSPAGQRYVQEEERAFPNRPDRSPSPPQMRRVDSPMAAAQMKEAKDEDIVHLFGTLTDATGWKHPTRGWPYVGGSIQASREFAEFSKHAPDRALSIVERFEPGKAERPAGDALAALGDSAVPVAKLIECIRQLDGRGFASEPFRIGAARCLREVALRNQGLEDDTCELLAGWITEHSSAHDDSGAAGDDTFGHGTSILWSTHDFVALPQGNYPILDALMLGYLLRPQPDMNGWVTVLERHLKRNESLKVWSALARDMPYLVNAEDERGIDFLGALFAHYPELLNTRSGVLLIGHVVDRLPDEMTDRIVNGWISGGWEHGPQVAGEVAALSLCRKPESAVARERVDRFLRGDNFDSNTMRRLQVGLTYSLARAWNQSHLRQLSTPLLTRLIDTAGDSIATALHVLFRRSESLPIGAHTRQLLEAALQQPPILEGQNMYFLVKGLKGLLYEDGYPAIVYDVARTVVEEAGRSRSGADKVQNLSELADLALTLHRIEDTREHGLDLFELLLRADAPGLSESLKMIDRPAFR
ncbi:MAG: TIR domain-containing protein [Gammaproteobacteria bacterium]|nr:TIR domain-containing protein [Gammaproteobacteria bacterium]